MKKIIIILIFMSQVFSQEIDWNVQEWWADDKQQHYNCSFLISSTIFGIAKNQRASNLVASITAIGTTLIIGWIKEQNDGFGDGNKEIGDIDADALGAISGAVSMIFIYKIEF